MSSFSLKIIASILMILDHIYRYFSNIPICFTWLGRLSAPIFIFVIAHSYDYTKDKRKLLGRLYLLSVIVALINVVIDPLFFQGFGRSFYDLNIFRTLFITILFLRFIELYKSDIYQFQRYIRWYGMLHIIFFVFCLGVIYSNIHHEEAILTVVAALLGLMINIEGGLIFVLLGIVIYFAKKKKKTLIIAYVTFCVTFAFVVEKDIVPRLYSSISGIPIVKSLVEFMFNVIGIPTHPYHLFSLHNMFYENYQWMMIGALPFMLLYNKKRGYKFKWFFYFLYPAHLMLIRVVIVLFD